MAKYKKPHLPKVLATFLVFCLLVWRAFWICLSPIRPFLRVLIVFISLWLWVGALNYGVALYLHTQKVNANLRARQTIIERKKLWENVLRTHPTSRDALLGAYFTSFALGADESAYQYKLQLEKIDPNHPLVKLIK